MSLTPRKRKSKHTHTTTEVKEAAKYETERPPHKPVPAAEVILYSDEETTSTLKDWQSSSDATKIDTDKFDVPPQDVTNEDSGYFVDTSLIPPTISVTAKETDTASTFKTWIEITITRESNMAGYVVSYREFGEAEWHHIHVEQPESGNPTVSTPELKENTTYEVHACKITASGKASPWSTTQTVTTETNDTAPPTPTGLSPTNVIDGVLLEWTAVTATDFSHYKIYYGTSSPPANVAGETTRPFFLWKKIPSEGYEVFYFAVSAVDTAGNESAKSSEVWGVPIQVQAADLSIESRPWTADMQIVVDDEEYGLISYSAADGVSNITVKFADSSTKTLTKGKRWVTDSLCFLYWKGASSSVQYTTDYTETVGTGRGLLAGITADITSSTQTRYFANADSDKAGYKKFTLENTSTSTTISTSVDGGTNAYVGVRIRKYNNGTPTTVVDWTETAAPSSLSEAIINVTVPATTFDRVIVDLRARVDTQTSEQSFITKEINLELSGTWTFHIWSIKSTVETTLTCVIYYGSSTYNTRCINFPLPTMTSPVTVAPFSSYQPTISAGAIAAKSILTKHIKSSQIVADHIASGQIKADHLDAGCVTSEKIYTGAVTTNKLDADAVTADKIAANAVQAEHIEAGAVNTEHVRFNSLTSDPTYETGKMWWRSDKDQLRFSSGTTINDVAIVPKYPLYDVQAPPENMVPNQSFEIDRDEDGVPDFWSTQTLSGSPSFGRDASSVKGGYSAKIVLSATGEGKLKSIFIPVTTGKTYYISVSYKGSTGKTHEYSVVHLEVFDRNQSYDNDKYYEVDPSDEWKTTTTSFAKKEFTYTVPTSHLAKDGVTTIYPRYIRVVLRNYGSSTTYETIYYDDVMFSELRAAEPTAGTVASHASGSGTATSVSGNTWTELHSITVPNEDHEILFVRLGVARHTNNSLIDGIVRAKVDSTYYPSSSGITVWQSGHADTYTYAYVTITIPSNVKGKTLKLEFQTSNANADTYHGEIQTWGHSPHYHR